MVPLMTQMQWKKKACLLVGSAGEKQRPGSSPAVAPPVPVLQPDHALTKGIHQVVVGGIGEPQKLGDQLVIAALAKTQLPCLQQWCDGMGAGHLAAYWPHRHQSWDLTLQQLADSWTVGGVFYQDCIRGKALQSQRGQGLAEGFNDTGQIEALVASPEHFDQVGACSGAHLSGWG